MAFPYPRETLARAAALSEQILILKPDLVMFSPLRTRVRPSPLTPRSLSGARVSSTISVFLPDKHQACS